jgi:hypothetical protein
MGRGILLWLLGRPNPDYHPSRALLALTELKLHRTLCGPPKAVYFAWASGLGLNQAAKLWTPRCRKRSETNDAFTELKWSQRERPSGGIKC